MSPRPAPRSVRASRKDARTPKRRRWPLIIAAIISLPLVGLSAALGYYYVAFSRLIDERLALAQNRTLPRVYGRALQLRPRQGMSEQQFVDRLNDLGYSHRAQLEQPGDFALERGAVTLIPRGGSTAGRVVRIAFRQQGTSGRIESISAAKPMNRLTLEPPLLTELAPSGRQKRRTVALDQIPRHLVHAVLAIEDHRFYAHPGVDIVRALGAAVTNMRGDKPYLVGGSTLTQQLVKNTFLTPEKTMKRKVLEQFMSVLVERRLTKDEILALYLNDVYLGHRDSFAVHGVAEAARLFFGKDVRNVTLAEAATIAGVIQSPQVHSPLRSRARARERRNVVLDAMVRAGFVPASVADRVSREPVVVEERAMESEAPYFVDHVAHIVALDYPDILTTGAAIHTTLDLHLQRIAEDAVRTGLMRVDGLLSRARTRRAQAALIAVDARTGDILALVGGRSYSASQYNRATHARRQPGSAFKPFVYLAAFERAGAEGWTSLTPATVMMDEPTTFEFEHQVWTPANYDGRFDGPITLRRALASSRNVPAVKVAEAAGYDRIAALWQKIGAGATARPYPSIALGVFETTPLEMARAYTIFPNRGMLRPLRAITSIAGYRGAPTVAQGKPVKIGRPETTYLVTSMMRSVLDEGTGAGARAAGFLLDAAGKSGTTNDLRDAWFVGFTPELLTVVWVGFDDNRPLKLSGTQAALPIWTTFMTRALAGHPNIPFETPEQISFVDVDGDTGGLATPFCPRVIREAFLPGSEPLAFCDLHRF